MPEVGKLSNRLEDLDMIHKCKGLKERQCEIRLWLCSSVCQIDYSDDVDLSQHRIDRRLTNVEMMTASNLSYVESMQFQFRCDCKTEKTSWANNQNTRMGMRAGGIPRWQGNRQWWADRLTQSFSFDSFNGMCSVWKHSGNASGVSNSNGAAGPHNTINSTIRLERKNPNSKMAKSAGSITQSVPSDQLISRGNQYFKSHVWVAGDAAPLVLQMELPTVVPIRPDFWAYKRSHIPSLCDSFYSDDGGVYLLGLWLTIRSFSGSLLQLIGIAELCNTISVHEILRPSPIEILQESQWFAIWLGYSHGYLYNNHSLSVIMGKRE
jgi:hypothetical protein